MLRLAACRHSFPLLIVKLRDRRPRLAPSGLTDDDPSMGWTYDSDSPRQDTSVSMEDEMALLVAPQVIPLRYKLLRLWRFLTRRQG